MSVFFGTVQVEILSADIEGVIFQLNSKKIPLYDVEYVDELTVRLTLDRNAYSYLKGLKKNVQDIRITKHIGVYWKLRALAARPVLLLTLLLLMFATVYLPSRVLFVEVSGNNTVAKNLILEQAQECGISFGASRKTVRSERVKNALLERIPQLKWAAVTTSGCTATVHVREEEKEQHTEQKTVGSIVAIRDGIIEQMTVTRGTPLCQVGDAVTAGQILVSGYTDCGICIQAARAEAEIYAQTLRRIRAVAMEPTAVRGEQVREETRFMLRVGKKLIKLYKDSGISDTTYVKIYWQYPVHLPGQLSLPLAVIKEKLIYTDFTDDKNGECLDWIENAASDYITKQMLAGSISEGSTFTGKMPGIYYLDGTYSCKEIIGHIKSEEILQSDAESD